VVSFNTGRLVADWPVQNMNPEVTMRMITIPECHSINVLHAMQIV
jgi:hypothetical protein